MRKQCLFFSVCLLLGLTIQSQAQQIGANITEASSVRFASSIAMSADGTIVAVGDMDYNGVGGVFVYQRNGNTWEPYPSMGNNIITIASATDDDFGGNISMSSNGSMIAIGAPQTNSNRGTVYIYELNVTWTQIGRIEGASGQTSQFGANVSLLPNGTHLVVGAPYYDDTFFNTGRVYFFEHTGGTSWLLRNTLTGEEQSDLFGNALSWSGEILGSSVLAIGAPGQNSLSAGKVYIYDYDNNNWTQKGSTIIGASLDSRFGASVSISPSSNIIAVGTKLTSLRGEVNVYEYNNSGSNWEKKGQTISGVGDLDNSYQVSLNGTGTLAGGGIFMVIGGSGYDGVNNKGHVRIYQYDDSQLEGSEWVKKGDDIIGNNGDLLGYRVSLSGTNGMTLAIAAVNNYVSVYDLSSLLNSNKYELENLTVLYPNPVEENNSITIEFSNDLGSRVKEYSIYDNLGCLVQHIKNTNETSKHLIATKKLQSGIYYLQIKTEDNDTAVKKFTIK